MNTNINVEIVNDAPVIKISSKLNGVIGTTDFDSNYLDNATLDGISNSAKNYLESNISKYLYKLSKDYKSDITNIGKSALKEFNTWNDYENYNWKERFADSTFDVKVDVNIKSGSLITQT